MTCPACGRENPAHVDTCAHCGSRLALDCPSCGSVTRPLDDFCVKCGQSLSQAPTQSIPASQLLAGTSSPSAPSAFANGRYLMRRFLGEGAKKRVYLAHDTLLDRDVAFALIKTAELDDLGRQRFLREARAMARLGDHPNIVQIHDLGDEDGRPYMVLPLMTGGSVSELLRDAADRRVTPGTAIGIAKDVCQGLRYAHSKGVVHRDLKPGNVWLAADGTAKIGDFGLALSQDRPRLTQERVVMGTVAYMPPEQATGGQVDQRSDLYSLGCMIYELVTGRPPFLGNDLVSVVAQHVSALPTPPSRYAPGCPPSLEAVILRLLAKRPADRLESATEVLAALERPGPIAGLEEPSPGTEETPAVLQKPVGASPHNLPIQLTSFIGRAREIEEVKALLGGARLVTLTGAGGCGKTRLALRVAGELLREYPDGVWLVEVAPVSDGALVVQAVASPLGVREEATRPLLATLLDYLRPKRLLLVLDNCEHLVEACARLANGLLQACADLRVLATSREALGVGGEVSWRVPSLSVPPGAEARPVKDLLEYEAVRLFSERAGLAQPGFELTARNAGAVAEVCRRLDGVPLAIELAAAQVKVLAPEQISARLDDRFRLLVGGSRTALPHHQTLRATVEWSYDLLSDEERRLFKRQSVFAGGFTLEAAEDVCAPTDGERAEVLELLARLIDKSLVVPEPGFAGVGRYRMLETLRQFGQQHLAAGGEARETQGRHAAFFLALSERAEPQLGGPQQEEWLRRLDLEHDNLCEALGWCLESGEAQTALRLAGALARYWYARGYIGEGRQSLGAALQVAAASGRTAVRAKALNGAGVLADVQGDYVAARPLYEESMEIWRELGDDRAIARSLYYLGSVAREQGDFGAARSLYQESLRMLRGLGDRWAAAFLLEGFASLAAATAQNERALWLAGAAAALRAAMGASLSGAEQATLDGALVPSRRALGPENSAEAWSRGQGMGLEAAMAYALEEATVS